MIYLKSLPDFPMSIKFPNTTKKRKQLCIVINVTNFRNNAAFLDILHFFQNVSQIDSHIFICLLKRSKIQMILGKNDKIIFWGWNFNEKKKKWGRSQFGDIYEVLQSCLQFLFLE